MPIGQSTGFAVPEVQLPIISSLGLINEDNAWEFYKAFPDMGRASIVAQLEAEGKVKITDQETYRMWVKNSKPRNYFRVDDDIEITNSGAITVTVVDYTDVGETLSAPAVGLFFIESSTGIEFEVRAVSKTTAGAHTATIAPTSTGVTVTIPEADAYFISTGRQSVQESSFQQDGEYDSWIDRLNKTSIVRTNKQYSDKVSMEKVTYFDQDYMTIDRDSMNKQHIDAKEFQFMHGDVRNNVQSTGNQNNTALGVLPLVQQYGTVLNGTGTGASLSATFFQDLSRAIDGNGFSNSYQGLADTEALFKIQDFLQSQSSLVPTLIVNNGDRTDLQVVFDYSTNFAYYGIDYSFKKYDYWNVARLAGAPTQNSAWANQILLMPTGTKVDGSGETRNALRVRYQDNNLPTDEGRINKFDTDGALFGKNTTRNAELSLTSYIGADALDLESFIYVKLA